MNFAEIGVVLCMLRRLVEEACEALNALRCPD